MNRTCGGSSNVYIKTPTHLSVCYYSYGHRCMGVNIGGLGVANPRFWVGVVGVLGGCERVSQNTIAYFGQKVAYVRNKCVGSFL